MNSKKITPNKVLVLVVTSTLFVGILIGLSIGNVPYVSFKNEVDAGSVIAILGLFVTIVIVPFLVNRLIANQDNTHQIIVGDLDECLERLHEVSQTFGNFNHLGQSISDKDRRSYLSEVRRLNKCLMNLAETLDKHESLKSFRQTVFDAYLADTFSAITDTINVGTVLDDSAYLAGANKLDSHITEVKKYKYMIYSW